MINKAFFYLLSAALIAASLALGNWLQDLFALSVPGSVIGLLILFVGLVSGLVKPHWVQPSASLLIKYMILLFIPISTGLMIHYQILVDNALAIIISTVFGTLFVLCILSLVLDKLLNEDR
ncbi:CidA/LrgA family protein [Vibrio neonatus]|uniref:CidA/LrgA family protein n=1 Tax=Vibrio neonatus TaxID=278860 RepID=UPI0021C3E738|nr:CidA/LrgA family protein [Vibrio neonatus]